MARMGLDKLFYAPITEDEQGYEEYGTPKELAAVVSANITDNKTEYDFNASDRVVVKGEEWTDTKIDFVTDDIPPKIEAELLGADYNDADKLLTSSTNNIAGLFAVGYRSLGTDGTYVYTWYLRGKFSRPTVQHQTKGTAITTQGTNISYNAVPTKKEYVIEGKTKPLMVLKGVSGMTSVAIIDKWFVEVPVPNSEPEPEPELEP